MKKFIIFILAALAVVTISGCAPVPEGGYDPEPGTLTEEGYEYLHELQSQGYSDEVCFHVVFMSWSLDEALAYEENHN